MIRPTALRLAILVLSFGTALSGALAADTYEPETAPATTPDDRVSLVLELGAGGLVSPAYEGSDEYEVSPFPIISLDYLNIPGLFEIGGGDGKGGGFSIGPSFDYIGERDDDDHDKLFGLDDVDATYQAGIRVGYEWSYAEVYGEARYAFGGAEGFVGAVGANAIARPMDTLELKAGPRATFASDDYMDTYFSVSPEESIASGGRFDTFEADGGFKSVGLGATARYEFRPDWFLNAEASYDQLIEDAGDSPIVDVGAKEQYTFGLGISKRFSLNF